MRKLRYGKPNDMQFGANSGAYRCHSCGHEKNHIEDVRTVTTEHGAEAELTLSCDHCTTLSVFQITSSGGYIFMGVVAHAMNTLDADAMDQRQLDLRLEIPVWP